MNLRSLFDKVPRLDKSPGRARRAVRQKAQLALPAAPVLLLATGAGVAVWWWTQWARGRAESERTEGTDPAADIPPTQGGSA